MDQQALFELIKQMMEHQGDDDGEKIPKYIRMESDENMKAYLMGMSRVYGVGGGLRRKQVNKLLKQLCDSRCPAAIASYGNRLYKGIGMRQDQEEGVRMILEAGEMGYEYANELIGKIFNEDDDSEVEVLEIGDKDE